MNFRYVATAVCLCPVDNSLDVYRVEITSPTMIKVEDIKDALEDFRGKKLFQEALTAMLAQSLFATVVTTGCHSGVFTEVSAP